MNHDDFVSDVLTGICLCGAPAISVNHANGDAFCDGCLNPTDPGEPVGPRAATIGRYRTAVR